MTCLYLHHSSEGYNVNNILLEGNRPSMKFSRQRKRDRHCVTLRSIENISPITQTEDFLFDCVTKHNCLRKAGRSTDPGQSFSLSLSGPISISRANAHMVHMGYKTSTSHYTTQIVYQLFLVQSNLYITATLGT